MNDRYLPPPWLRNGHIQSIYPSLFRRVDDGFLTRERITTPDGDFLDLDWAKSSATRLVVLTHGLEGNSRRPYMLGMMRAALRNRWDTLAWNFRSCSGEPNQKLTSYHSGQIHDLELVVKHALAQGYKEVALVGFSIGGNKTLRYLSLSEELPDEVSCAVTFSVPVDLKSSAVTLSSWSNRLYMKNFMSSFREKLELKADLYPGTIDLDGFSRINTFLEYDSRYTAPMNGFESAEAYWETSSSKPYLERIERPTLLLSALDDPFLSAECFPYDEASRNPFFSLETPRHGGHVGFMPEARGKDYYSERRAIDFLTQHSC